MTDKGLIEKLTERYRRAGHKVQTAIAFHPDRPTDQYKDLRTGVDLSKSDMAGLARLLISKGVFTEADYIAAITEAAEAEAAAKEDELSARFGITFTTL
jgi:hypothetical protein